MSPDATKQTNRLHRQFDAIARRSPSLRSFLDRLLGRRMRLLRLPLGVLLILGSLLAILPVFGLWMLPLGLMLLAIDIPALRPRVSAALISARRRYAVWRHKAR